MIESDFNLSGKWLSSGGESKEFIHRDFVLKWQGKSKQRLTVVKDNQQSYLLNALKGYASEMDAENTVNTFSDSEANEGKFVEHVVVEIIDQDENNTSCFNNDRYLQDLNKIMSMISQLREAHEKERLNSITQAAKYEATNKALTEGQIKMAAEIQDLKSSVERLENENKSIRKVLGIKQDEWQKVETRKCSNSKKNEQKFEISVQNSFSGLEIEDSKLTSFPEIIDIEKKTEKRSRKNEKCPNGNHLNIRECPGNATTKHQDPAKPNEKITLVIGDSMVKNIDSKKIERACGHKSVCHSGAKVKQIEDKLKSDGDRKYDSVILHVGTNDLAHADANKVAKDMDDLIYEVKTRTKKIAVSSVIYRYDGRDHSNKIDQYNKLLENLCVKHKATFINNNNIDESRLNGSKLHLNRFGDIALGYAFCSYLKSHGTKTRNPRPSDQRLENLSKPCQANDGIIPNADNFNDISSDFHNCLTSVPKERGFKMAFLNIVSLPKKIGEIRYSMSEKNIDLIAFNETQLDASISNNILHLSDYDIIRKDRSRSGGGVCIYLRSSINYKLRHDLVPTELEAVCLEIVKPHSKPFLVTTVYRPPNAPADFFEHFESLIKAIDDENKEFYILGDLNCDMLKTDGNENMQIKKIKSLYELYQLTQLIQEATRVTMTTSTLIDHIITNTPTNICYSGVIHTGISNHSLVFAIRKISVARKVEHTVEIRTMKKFDTKKFVEDLIQQPWENVYFFADTPNAKWEIWKILFL